MIYKICHRRPLLFNYANKINLTETSTPTLKLLNLKHVQNLHVKKIFKHISSYVPS